MRFITPTIHGYMDYLVAAALIAGPFLLFSAEADPIVFWLPVIAGGGLIGYSLMTDMSAGALKLIPFRLHLMIDLAAVLGFIALPLILGFGSIERLFYIGFGLAGLGFVFFTNPSEHASEASRH